MITVATHGKNTFKKGPEEVIKQIYQPAINSSVYSNIFVLVLLLIKYIKTSSHFNRKVFKPQYRWSHAKNHNDHKVAKHTNLHGLDGLFQKKKNVFQHGGWGRGKASHDCLLARE